MRLRGLLAAASQDADALRAQIEADAGTIERARDELHAAQAAPMLDPAREADVAARAAEIQAVVDVDAQAEAAAQKQIGAIAAERATLEARRASLQAQLAKNTGG